MRKLAQILKEEGLTHVASRWEKVRSDEWNLTNHLGTYYFLEGEGVIFQPSEKYLDALESEEVFLKTLEEAERWQTQHAAQHENTQVFSHPAEADLRAAAQKAEGVLRKLFRRKPEVWDNIRKRGASLTVYAGSLKLPLTSPADLQVLSDKVSKALGVRLTKSRSTSERSFPDPVEAEWESAGTMGSLKVTLTVNHMKGNVFGVGITFRA